MSALAEIFKHGNHDQRTHGNRYGGGFWGGSRGASTLMTGLSAEAMGLEGYRTFQTDREREFGRRSSIGMLRGIKNAKPRKRSLYHGEESTAAKAAQLEVGAKIKLPLTATANDHLSAHSYARKEEIHSDKVSVMMEFLPGVKAYNYGGGEHITAGDFVVKEVKAGEPIYAFDYDKQEDNWIPVKHVVLEQVAIFDPDDVSKAIPHWDGDGVQGAGQPRDPRTGRWVDRSSKLSRIYHDFAGADKKKIKGTDLRFEEGKDTFFPGGSYFLTHGHRSLVSNKTGRVFFGDFEVFEVADDDNGSAAIWSGKGKDKKFNSLRRQLMKKAKGDDRKFKELLRDELRSEGFDGIWVGGEVIIWNYDKLQDPKKISKAQIDWDGDGLQGAGQLRDRMGRWVKLPGTSALKKVGAFELADGTYGVFKDGENEPYKTFKTKKAANKEVARKIKSDAEAYYRDRIAPKKQKEHNRYLKQKAAAEKQILAEQAEARAKGPVPKKGRAAKKPARASVKVTASEVERLPVPGQPNAQQAKDAAAFARREMKDNEAKYAELVIRLLKNKGITQDPTRRGAIKDRYDISPARQVEIETTVYGHMFPQKKKRNLRVVGSGKITEQQKKAIRKEGGLRALALASPDNPLEPERMFKANKGPNKGKWIKVSWNGTTDVMDPIDAIDAMVEAKLFWTGRMLRDKERMEKMRQKRRAENNRLLTEFDLNRKQLKDFKIQIARKWARDNGLDENDTYWWGVFWNDNSLVSSDRMQEKLEDPDARKLIINNLSPAMERERMDPAILEGILSLPDISSRDIRRHRPGPRRPIKGDEDFVAAEDQPEGTFAEADWRRWSARQKRRAERAAKKKEIQKADPLWDGDGLQGVGQPRNRSGRWSKHRTLTSTMQHHGTETNRRAKSGVFDSKRKRITEAAERALKPLPHQGVDKPLGPNGKPIARKNIPWQEALYLRNNGTTKISNERLAEIYNDRSKITPAERDLLMSAGARMDIDGGKEEVKVFVVRDKKFKKKARFFVMNTLRKEIANDAHRKSGARGSGGHIIRRHDIDTEKKKKENKKRVASGRNKVNAATRVQIIQDFKDPSGNVKCIFCGRNIRNFDNVSPERMKPGPLGGKYERGNMAPAHESCNTKRGGDVNVDPGGYYDEMMKRFTSMYAPQIGQGKLKFVFAKHRGKLGAAPR